MIAALYSHPTEALTRELIFWSWQTILLLSCVLLLCRLLNSSGAWLRYNIWLCGLIAVALLPLWSEISGRLRIPKLRGAAAVTQLVNLPTAVGLPTVLGQDETSVSFSQATAAPPSNPSFAYALLFASWLGGAIITSAKVCIQYRRMRRIRRWARPATFAEIGCQQLTLARPEAALLALSTEIHSPMLLGLLRPMILLPADITEWTTAEERGWMVEHEMTHLSRRDNLIILFQGFMGIIFFFHPLVRYAIDQLSLERELACDDLIVRRGTISSRYAESLLKVVEHALPSQAAVPTLPFASRRTLQKRIDNIMKAKHPLEPGRRLIRLAPLAALVLAVMGLLGFVSAGGISREEQEVREFLREAMEAEISGGPETFDRLAAPDFVRIGAGGEVWNKEQMLAVVRRGKISVTEAVEIRDERIRIYGNTAVVTGLGIARGHDRTGREFVVRNLCTIVLVKRDGSWRCVSVQQTRQV